MKLVRGAWKLLVGIKDALVLLLMLLFFGALFAALSMRPNTRITDGALVLDLSGTIVEQPSEADPVAALSGQKIAQQLRLRDVVRALDAARSDTRVKAVVLDLDRFAGGYPATLSEVGDAVARVRAGGKPVLAYATLYTDGAYRIASNASEIWQDPFGGTMFRGPGGSAPYMKGLIDKLGINAHVYRVGQFKSAVEPFTRSDQSEPARAADRALYGAIFDQWLAAVKKARPKAQIDAFVTRPAEMVQAAGGDIAQANLRGGLVDHLGDRIAFGARVAKLAGVDDAKPAGSYRKIDYANWLAANPVKTGGDAIGVITIAGEIVDGQAGPGTAAGDTIAKLLLDGLATKNLKALVVRVDSPGGSVLASERIRQAILQAKAKKIPVVVSMGGLAASGGYWVSTPGDVVFAEPNTITGSIGVFAVIPTFENTLAKIGVTADGVTTTPLGAQPDVMRGTSPAFDAIMQSNVESIYGRFTGLVAQSRRLSQARVDQIGQGRVWDGGTARQLRLVDRFGNLDDAVAEAAKRANLDPAKVHAVFLEKQPGPLDALLKSFSQQKEDEAGAGDAATDIAGRIAGEQRAMLAQALGDARRMLSGRVGVQARCVECAGLGPVAASAADMSLLDLIVAKFGL